MRPAHVPRDTFFNVSGELSKDKTMNSNENNLVLCPDKALYTEEGLYEWSPARSQQAWEDTFNRCQELLSCPEVHSLALLIGVPGAGKSTWLETFRELDVVYVDGTFTSRIRRLPFIELAQQAGKAVGGVLIDTPLATCILRNAARDPDRRVPSESLTRMAVSLRDDPPTLQEGFTTLVAIR